MTPSRRPEHVTWIARAFTATEDFVYIGLGCLLAASAVTLLAKSVIAFWQGLVGGRISTIELLDRILLILLIVELLYTVQVSLREHTLVPEPFLLVGLISVIRRVLVLTAILGEKHEKNELPVQPMLLELAVLAGMIVALTAALVLLKRRDAR